MDDFGGGRSGGDRYGGGGDEGGRRGRGGRGGGGGGGGRDRDGGGGGGGGGRGGGGGGGGRGGRGGGGGMLRGGMHFQQHVPKFLQTMLQSNPSVRLQGQTMHAQGDDGGALSGFDAMASGIMQEAAMTRPTAAGSNGPKRDEGRERPDREDEAPQIANADEFGLEEISALLPALARKRERELAEAAEAEAKAKAAAANSDATTAAAASSPATAAPAAAPLTLTDARLLQVKRARVADPDADALEAQTGKHVFRKAAGASRIGASSAAGAEAAVEAGLSAEEKARRKKRRKEKEEAAKSRLTFDEADI